MSTTRIMKITGLAALALVATLTFAGCSGKSSSVTSTAPVASSTAAVVVTAATDPAVAPALIETPAPVVPAIGATVTTDAEQQAATDAGLLLWDMFDTTGNYVSSVVFAKDQPLPEAAKAAVASKVTALHATSVATGITGDHATSAQAYSVEVIQSGASATAARIATLSGRKILLVTPGYGELNGRYGWVWYAVASPSAAYPNQGVKTNASRDKFVAGLKVWVAAQADPASYDILIAD